ncbi:2-oxo-4-hydroxy-4-carboxy-5-ureidoimidazoline decarboxylase [Geodermatophilus siccatus]|uniref:2-oxo-4-hydroxy-4-carboxy-5-ureidoimidazoline decarboxylase n=1 Tax=Geodermatophilus siccatus TaxID=1137991 RepID=A0A1G9VPM3_9ACTN|nr:2-oxo-4-hydroxy-4-carboxy-5-ureidoimidazoline decarboxylase [Geodermatophilus siccatus]SDM74119.1 2-oxo-4-hydroxy-4-carboxy-5-ureidoimidazoline decarboxylase [Geodermatophilus siccatus]
MSGSVDELRAGLETLDALPADRAEEQLAACCAARAWVARMVAGRPYADVDDLLAASDRAIEDLGPGDLAEALAAHPRIGQRVAGSSPEAAWSRQEQSGMDDADTEVRAALREGNLAYEERFDQVFLIRAAGRSPAEMLTELRRRLGNDPETERREVAEQLRQITRLRLERSLQP